MSTTPKPEPLATPETRPFWEAAARGSLQVQLCDSCRRHYFYPRSACPHCGSADVSWVECSGRASLHSYVISHRPAPGFTPPFVIAVVELEEGPRMMTNLVGVDPDPSQLQLDMPLWVDFEPRGDHHLPVFRTSAAGTGTAKESHP